MAKRNRAVKTPPVTSHVSNGVSNPIENSLAAVSNFIDSQSNPTAGAIAEKLMIAKQSFYAADEEKKKQVSANLEENIQSLVGELKKLIENNKKLESDNKHSLARSKQLEDSVDDLKKSIEKERKELDKEKTELLAKQKKTAEERADIAIRLERLKEQEIDAEVGFASRHENMLASFEKEKEKIIDTWREKKSKLEQEVNKLTKAKESLNEEESLLIEKKLQEISTWEASLKEEEFKLKQEKTIIERRRKQAELTDEEATAYKKILRDEVKREFVYQINSLENQKENLQNQIAKYAEAEKQLLTQLSSYNDLERQFGDSSPQQAIKQLADYKKQVNELRQKLDEKPSDQIEQQFKELKNSYEALEQENNNIQVELQRKKIQLTKNLKSVIELEQVEKQKQLFEKHNQLLQAAINQLSTDVDDLVNKQQSKTPFPALVKLDSKLRFSVNTETIPSLKSFASEIQHRIAWDANENKALYLFGDN